MMVCGRFVEFVYLYKMIVSFLRFFAMCFEFCVQVTKKLSF